MKRTKWFRLLDDMRYPNRWQLGEPQLPGGAEEVDSWEFTMGGYWERGGGLTARADSGVALDFTLGALGVPFASPEFARLVVEASHSDVELVPVTVSEREMFILNVLRVADCLDEERSEFTKWSAKDGRPDRIDQYRMVSKLRIDPERAGPEGILRIKGWDVPLVVSELIKQEIERGSFRGPIFESLE